MDLLGRYREWVRRNSHVLSLAELGESPLRRRGVHKRAAAVARRAPAAPPPRLTAWPAAPPQASPT